MSIHVIGGDMANILKRVDIGGGKTRLQIRCPCGTVVTCTGFTNTCTNCNRDFNTSGQELAPREQWGDETGESVAEILSVDQPGE